MNTLLFLSISLIWGFTWFAINLQLGVVPPALSIMYRFGLAAIVVVVYCLIRGVPLSFRPRDHLYIALQGVVLFSVNFYFLYLASSEMASGLLSLIFSSTIIWNIILKWIAFGDKIEKRVILGAACGLIGISMVFFMELQQSTSLKGIGYGLLGTFLASTGNIMSAWNQKRGLKVASTNALGMVYGAIILSIIVFASDITLVYDPRPEYMLSLLYLAVFGSAIGFWVYLTLVGRVGPDRAGYATIAFPPIALAVSSIVEGYQWSIYSIVGTIVILVGNIVILAPKGTMNMVLRYRFGQQKF